MELNTYHKSKIYRIIYRSVMLFYPKMTVEGEENIPEEASLIIGNHSHTHGPIAAELYFPGKRYIWCTGEMTKCKEVPDYAYQDFWWQKPKLVKPFYRLLSYLIAPIASFVLSRADVIPVYKDMRIVSTFKTTMEKLDSGYHVIIYPEWRDPYNHIVNEFQENYVEVAKLYYKKTGKCLSFVPMYLCPNLHKMIFGEPIIYNPENSIREEKKRINVCLMEAITQMAVAQPEHRVIPYLNIPKKQYLSNKRENNPSSKGGCLNCTGTAE